MKKIILMLALATISQHASAKTLEIVEKSTGALLNVIDDGMAEISSVQLQEPGIAGLGVFASDSALCTIKTVNRKQAEQLAAYIKDPNSAVERVQCLVEKNEINIPGMAEGIANIDSIKLLDKNGAVIPMQTTK